MAKQTIGQKAARTVQLMVALRNPRVARVLARHGFTEADLRQGIDLLFALTRGRLDAPAATTGADPQVVREIDAWENKWFPIASAVLATNYPTAHELVFRNLTQTSGPEVVVTVGTMIARIEQLANGEDDGGLGRVGRDARALLVKRGLTDEVIEQARAMIERVGTISGVDELIEEGRSEEDLEAERRMWNWYLEWSSIARTVITDRRLLRQMGFLQGNGAQDPEEPGPSEPTPPPT